MLYINHRVAPNNKIVKLNGKGNNGCINSIQIQRMICIGHVKANNDKVLSYLIIPCREYFL